MQLSPDLPLGAPSFDLAADEIETVVDLVCLGASAARPQLTPGLLEVPMTIIVRKAIKRVKRTLGLTNLEIWGEVEMDDMSNEGAGLLGRIDIILKFMRQFGSEEDFVAVECKRVGAGSQFTQLNARYVTEGAVRFTNGQYAVGHNWGFMLGYALALPADAIVQAIDARLKKEFGDGAELTKAGSHVEALAIHEGPLPRPGGPDIRLRHILVDMTAAAPASNSTPMASEKASL